MQTSLSGKSVGLYESGNIPSALCIKCQCASLPRDARDLTGMTQTPELDLASLL